MAVEFQNIFTQTEVEKIAKDFPLLRGNGTNDKETYTYLDNAGASLYSRSQMAAVHEDMANHIFTNPHTHFGEPVLGKDDINSRVHEARQLILRFFQTDSDTYQVIFTSNATHGMKLVAENFDWSAESKFAYLDQCHTSAQGLREYPREKGCDIQVLTTENFENELAVTKVASLVVFPAMSNFCGQKFDYQRWTKFSQNKGWFVLVDAASLVSTSQLNLSEFKPNFVTLSFYKIFGYPTGLGALLVKRDNFSILKKSYFGGGTVEMNLVNEFVHFPKQDEGFFEDGTLPFLAIAALRHGFQVLNSLGISRISNHTFNLAKYFYHALITMKYENMNPVAKVYSRGFSSINHQGGIVNFNLLRRDGNLYGFSEFQKVAIHNRVIVRVGCFCNIGACQKYLGLTDEDVRANHAAGHVCGDGMDIVNGRPTGSIRISFGYYNTKDDADFVLDLIKTNFILRETSLPHVASTSSLQPKIVALYIYPIKSCAPMKVDNWPLGTNSLLYDRQFVILHGSSPLTQKSFPSLCLLKPTINPETKTMTLSFEGVRTISVAILDEKLATTKAFQVCTGKVCGDIIEGVDHGSEISEWLEDVTGLTGLKLVQLVTRSHKKSSAEKTLVQSFANEGQFLIINQSSCNELQVEDPSPDWLVEQFRGNIIIGEMEPFAEEDWETLEIPGVAKFEVISLCTRCTVIGLDQKTGQKVTQEQDPIKALAQRLGSSFKFGVLANLCSGQTHVGLSLAKNMEVQITRR